MINPNDTTIQWTQMAENDMPLISMIEHLYNLKLTKRYEERLDRGGQPFLHYKVLYENHKELLNDMVEIFFPNLNFTPSQITIKNTNEYYLFEVINAIFYIVWYRNMENNRPRGYEKTLNELDQALNYIYGYADCKEINKLIHFPAHQNEIIERLESYFIGIKRPQQGENVINKIKEYFGIKKLTATKYKKMINANKKVIEQLKKEQLLTDEDVKKIPIIGQLQTKI